MNKKVSERVEDAPYSLPWLRKYRANIVQKMESLVENKKSVRTIKSALKKIEKLHEEERTILKRIREGCSHPLESQRYSESGRQDTLGGWRPGMDLRIQCTDCKKELFEGER